MRSSAQLYGLAVLNLVLAAFTWSPWALSWAWLCLVGAHLCEALEGPSDQKAAQSGEALEGDK